MKSIANNSLAICMALALATACSPEKEEKTGKEVENKEKTQESEKPKKKKVASVRVKAAPEGMKHYANRMVEVFYPKEGWALKEEKQMVFSLKHTDGVKMTEVEVEPKVLDGQDINLMQVAEVTVENLKKNAEIEVKDIKMKESTFHSYPSVELSFTGVVQGEERNIRQILFKSPEKGLGGIISIMNTKAYEEKMEEVDKILESFNIIYNKNM